MSVVKVVVSKELSVTDQRIGSWKRGWWVVCGFHSYLDVVCP